MTSEELQELNELRDLKRRLVGFAAGLEYGGNHRMVAALRWVQTGDWDTWRKADWTPPIPEPLPAVHSPHD